MKKIKIGICLLLVMVFCLGGFFLLKKDDYCYYLAIGDYISNEQVFEDKTVNSFSNLLGDFLVEEKVVNEVSTGYLKNNMTSKKMLEMIEKDSYKVDDSKLVDLIKKSKYITITLGINDVISQVKYDSYKNKIIYDKDVISNKIDIFKHNYHEIVEQIKDINGDAKVLLVGCYSLYGDKELSTLINDATKSVSEDTDSYYVDVSDIEDKYMYQDNQLYLTSLGQEEIYKKVINVIRNIEVL